MEAVKVGQMIANQRKKLNMTQMQLAEILNVSNKSISRWENGITMPDISLLIPLAEILQISLNELLSGEYKMHDKEDILRETIEMSVGQINRHKTVSSKLIMNLMVTGLLILTLLPWVEKQSVKMNLLSIYDSHFFLLLLILTDYLVLINLCDQNKKYVRVLSYLVLLLVLLLLIIDATWAANTIILKEKVFPLEITAVPFLTIICAISMIIVHSILFNKNRMGKMKEVKGNKADNYEREDKDNGHLIMFILAAVNVLFIEYVPLYDHYHPISFIASFVEKRPIWYGNYPKDLYKGVILTYGYISLLICPLLCLWTKLRSKIIFVLTSVCLIHVLACILYFPYRFKADVSTDMLKYIAMCLIPVIILFLLFKMYLRKTFIERDRKSLDRRDYVSQLIYLLLIVRLDSYYFMVTPFVKKTSTVSGQWYLITFLAALSIVTVAILVFDVIKVPEKLEKKTIDENKS